MSSSARAAIFSGEDVAAFETSSATLSPVKDGLSPNAGPADSEDEDEEEEEEEEEFGGDWFLSAEDISLELRLSNESERRWVEGGEGGQCERAK